MPNMDQIAELLKTIQEYLHWPLVIVFSAVGLWVALIHLKEMLADYVERFRDKEHRYRIRTTIVKDLMDETVTQTAKLRRLRVSKNLKEVILDPWPTIIPENSDPRPGNLTHFYSVPGRLGTQNDPARVDDGKKFLLVLGRDEELKKHKEYSTLLVYTLQEPLDEILKPPAFIAVQPVGKECFTYEAHFPAGRRFVRNKNLEDPNSVIEPRIKVYRGKEEKERELIYEPYGWSKDRGLRKIWAPVRNKFRTRYHVIGGRTDFGDGHGAHDWFRVIVLKPPQNENIVICWCMQNDPTTWKWCSHTAEDHN